MIWCVATVSANSIRLTAVDAGGKYEQIKRIIRYVTHFDERTVYTYMASRYDVFNIVVAHTLQ